MPKSNQDHSTNDRIIPNEINEVANELRRLALKYQTMPRTEKPVISKTELLKALEQGEEGNT